MFNTYRKSFIGFDQLFDTLDKQLSTETITYPPYNYIKIDDDNYMLEFAVAGFNKDELTVTKDNNKLIVSGKKDKKSDLNYIHKGISNRTFKISFELSDTVNINKASFENGILTVELHREIPEELKPKIITIE